MKDQDAIDTLIDRHGSVAKAAASLGIIETRMANWRRRGISNEGRPLVYKALRRLKVKVPVEFAFSREHDYSNLGATNGRAGKPGRKASPKRKRQRNGRPQLKGKNGQKRRGQRRGVPTMDAKNRGRQNRRGESRQAA
jgi:hypothetical protein